jgi:hypothetical protein
LGDLLTNAKKVTVSVLYWYGKLSKTWKIFEMIRKRIKTSFLFFSRGPWWQVPAVWVFLTGFWITVVFVLYWYGKLCKTIMELLQFDSEKNATFGILPQEPLKVEFSALY